MNVRIVQDDQVDILDVIRRSSHGASPNAERSLSSFMLASSEVWVGYAGDEVACICGLITPTMLSDRAYLWLLTTSLVDDHPFLFIRHSQVWMEQVKKRYRLIAGDVEIGNDKAKRWLGWLGAEFGYPSDGRIPFTIESE